ncbi:MAG: LCP family protein [Anaerolineae bacterium]|nr:LCP family protein [Anaerolineae bacterium]NUQ02491.1 LCP family protein [Anaerolineae bacterium]
MRATWLPLSWCLLLTILLVAVPVHLGAQESDGSTSSDSPYVIEYPDEIPPPMPMADEGIYDILNILLLGSDTENPRNAGRTDVLLIASINRTTNTVSFLSLPRDLYVYIPGERVYRINSAYGFGQRRDGGGAELISETIRYNLGIEIDYYARVDFGEFRTIIDALGGVDITVDCLIEDWKLKDPDADPSVEENWEIFTLPVGLYHMDGELALWYARSRRTTSDFDRGRRHQALLRAIWRRVRELGLIQQAAELWAQVSSIVETDIDVQDVIGLLPLAASLDNYHLRSFVFRQNQEVTGWVSPEGSSVLVPNRELIASLIEALYLPSPIRTLVEETPRVLIVNASGYRALALVAADRLAWEGYSVTISSEMIPYQDRTNLTDLTGRTKGNMVRTLQSVLRLDEGQMEFAPDGERQYDYILTLGADFSACGR